MIVTNPSKDAAHARPGWRAVFSGFGRKRPETVEAIRPGDGALCLFLVSKGDPGWRVLRDGEPFAELETRGDAVRAACLGARTSDAAGRPAQVLTLPGKLALSHYEPHFAD